MDDTVLIIARGLLIAVFTVSAVAKLFDRSGSREAMEGFGVPPRLIASVTAVLPVAELAAAALLIPESTAMFGGALAIVLFVAFTAGIATAMRRGRAPACHCFGALSAEPVGRSTLVRNVLLIAFAVVVLVGGGGPSFSSWAGDRGAQSVALVVTSTTTVALLIAYARLWRRGGAGIMLPPDYAEPIPIGDVAPPFEVQTIDGEPLASDTLLNHGKPSILVFTSSTCAPCHELLPTLGRWQRMLDDRLSLCVIAAGPAKDNRELAQTHGVRVVVDERASVSTAYRVAGTPSAIEIDKAGLVASYHHPGAASIEALIRAALKRGS